MPVVKCVCVYVYLCVYAYPRMEGLYYVGFDRGKFLYEA